MGIYFQDGDRAAGVFGVLSAGFAILLGFVVFLAFSSYGGLRPVAMERTLEQPDLAARAVRLGLSPPCDAHGGAN